MATISRPVSSEKGWPFLDKQGDVVAPHGAWRWTCPKGQQKVGRQGEAGGGFLYFIDRQGNVPR
jgi:hypothetical protein